MVETVRNPMSLCWVGSEPVFLKYNTRNHTGIAFALAVSEYCRRLIVDGIWYRDLATWIWVVQPGDYGYEAAMPIYGENTFRVYGEQ